jgi:hypothetical protein
LATPEKIKTTTVMLIRLLLSHTSPFFLYFNISQKELSEGSRKNGNNPRAPTHIHLHSKLPVEANPNWGKGEDVTLNEVQNFHLHWTR